VEGLRDVADVVLAHHERWDGQGYPRGLKGEEIPEEARIIAVADALEAMTSDRPHRPARPFESALEEVRGCRGTQFDPDVVDAAESVDPAEWEAARERPGRPDHLRSLQAGYL
jgi:HD-GYP domain-containing protein (c-di-GMP phosphodiesterase class II)